MNDIRSTKEPEMFTPDLFLVAEAESRRDQALTLSHEVALARRARSARRRAERVKSHHRAADATRIR
jgi:hypothetical protein